VYNCYTLYGWESIPKIWKVSSVLSRRPNRLLGAPKFFKFIDSSKMAEALPSAAKIKRLEAVPLLTTSSDTDTIWPYWCAVPSFDKHVPSVPSEILLLRKLKTKSKYYFKTINCADYKKHYIYIKSEKLNP